MKFTIVSLSDYIIYIEITPLYPSHTSLGDKTVKMRGNLVIIVLLYGVCEASEGRANSRIRGVSFTRSKGKVQNVSKDQRFWPPGPKESRCKSKYILILVFLCYNLSVC